MSQLVVFKSYACKLEYFKCVEIVYPEKQNDPILVEVTLTDGTKNCVFAAQNIIACWLFLETVKIIDVAANEGFFYPVSLPIFDRKNEETCSCGGILRRTYFNTSPTTLEVKWKCEKCNKSYETQELLKKDS